MNKNIFRQADSRWGSLKYPSGGYTMKNSGCGCCAVTHVAIENPKYANYTPADVRKFMVTYATKGHGTKWVGITKGLENYGYNVHWNQNDNMTTIFNVLSNSLKRGVILFGSKKGPDGTRWTDGGHYIGFVDYKIQNGKHYFYLKDSGGRHHDGWWQYEKSMRGDIKQLWICTSWKSAPAPTPAPTTKYTGTIPSPTIKKGSKGDKVKNLQKFLNWYGNYGLVVDGICGAKTVDALKKFQKATGLTADGIYGAKTQAKAKTFAQATSSSSSSSSSTAAGTKCIDVSYWQGKISLDNWKKIKKTCGYAICRSSYTSQSKFSLGVDSTFETNYKNAMAAGLKVGVYHYSQAISVDEAKKEAQFMCDIIKKYSKPTFYVVCDFEYGGRLNSKIGKKASDIANAFCDVVKANGYQPCIYANTSTLNSNLTNPKYPVWVAQYASSCTYKKDKVMWQYTSSGKVDGISKSNTNNGSDKVDLSYVYKDCPITTTPTTTTTTTTTTQPTTTTTTTGQKYTGAFPDLVEHSRQKISYTGRALAYPAGTAKSKYTYGKGKATDAFTTAINKVYPKRSSWSKQCQAGASCDVGAGTVIRYAGYDTIIPRGLEEQIPHLQKSSAWTKTNLTKTSQMKAGDVGIYIGKTKGAHIWIGVGSGQIVEANHTAKYFLHVDTDNYTSSGKKTWGIYRACKPMSIRKGDKGTEVLKLQNFLNWAGFDCGKADADFGEKTENAVKGFQVRVGLTSDGIFGNQSLEKAKLYIVQQNTETPTTPPPAEPETPATPTTPKYTGVIPSIHVKKTSAQVISDALKWGAWIAGNNKYHYGEYGKKDYATPGSKYYEGGKYKAIYNVTHSCGCPFCGTEKKKKVDKANKLGYNGTNWEYTYVCNTFATAIYAHGGMEATAMDKCRNAKVFNIGDDGRSSTLDKSKNWTYKGKLAIKDLKAGDILVNKYHMQTVYAPVSSTKVKIIESTSYFGKYKSAASNNSIRIKEKKPSYTSVYRFTGSVDADISIRYGEYSSRVSNWQEFLNWAGFNCGQVDGKFGDGTLAQTKAFQTKFGLTADGIVGPKTLEKANTFK